MLEELLNKEKPDMILVHGDTTSAYAAALSAFYHNIPVGHVEAGLRTYNMHSPFPEEFNRQSIDLVSDILFAPTQYAKDMLLSEKKGENKIFVTGNTVIDALKTTVCKSYNITECCEDDKLILLTAHRRENIGEPMKNIFSAVNKITEDYPEIKVIYPVHKNPKIREIANQFFANNSKVKMIEPMDVYDFHNVMNKSYLILTDSGGIYLGSIKSLFNNDSRLGVLIPPMKTFGKVSLSLSHSWINLNVFEKMKDKLGITVPYLLDKAPVYQINGLVCRKELLSNDVIKLLELDKTGTILQMIPLIAQEKGYYTKQVITKDYVATQIYNLTGMLSVLGEKISDNARNYSVREMTDQLMEEKIKHFLVSAKKVYIYGAGELACRVAEIAKKYCNLRGILVSDKRSNLSNICGIQVMQYSELKYKDIDVIVAVGKKNNRNIERILKDDNIKNILYVD